MDSPSTHITRRLSRYAHQPLLLPRDFSAGFIPELLDLEHLFSRVDYMGDPMARKRARLPSFPRNFGDVIVLDDVDQRIREIVFKDPVIVDQQAASAFPPPSADLLPLPGPEPIGPDPRFDDIFPPRQDLGPDLRRPRTLDWPAARNGPHPRGPHPPQAPQLSLDSPGRYCATTSRPRPRGGSPEGASRPRPRCGGGRRGPSRAAGG